MRNSLHLETTFSFFERLKSTRSFVKTAFLLLCFVFIGLHQAVAQEFSATENVIVNGATPVC